MAWIIVAKRIDGWRYHRSVGWNRSGWRCREERVVSDMKLRHAAVLALIGWYLMVPPLRSTGSSECYDAKVPISQWQRIKAFDTAEQCKVASKKSAFAHKQHGLDCGLASAWLDAQCIATDDPRLKPK